MFPLHQICRLENDWQNIAAKGAFLIGGSLSSVRGRSQSKNGEKIAGRRYLTP